MINIGQLPPTKQERKQKPRIGTLVCFSILIQFLLVMVTYDKHSSWDSEQFQNATVFINKHTPNILLQKIVSKFQPQLSSPAESLIPPATLEELRSKIPTFTPNLDQAIRAKKNDTFSSIWTSNGGTEEEYAQLLTALEQGKISVPAIRSTFPIRIRKDVDGSILSLNIRVKEDSVLTIDRSLGGLFSARTVSEDLSEQERVVTGTIYSSFIEAATTAGLPISMVDDFVDLFGDRVEFRKDLQPGDTFAIIFSQKQAPDGTWLSAGTIRAASLHNAGKLKAIIRYKGKNGQFQSFDESGKPLGSYFLRYPVQFSRVSSVFSDSRLHPVLGIRRPHNGVDFAAPVGTPVRAVADGVIEFAGYQGGGGNTVKIAHNSKYSTGYLHLSKISSGLKKGTRVQRGQVIGNVGMTGLTSGPHLHFSMYENGKYIDPLKAKLPNVLSDKDLAPPQYVQTTLTTLQRHLDTVIVANNALRARRG